MATDAQKRTRQGEWVDIRECGDGLTRRVYRALVDVVCARCGAAIPPGGLFVRRSAPTGKMVQAPHCTRCVAVEPTRGERDDA